MRLCSVSPTKIQWVFLLTEYVKCGLWVVALSISYIGYRKFILLLLLLLLLQSALHPELGFGLRNCR
jgi:hypothetical protein